MHARQPISGLAAVAVVAALGSAAAIAAPMKIEAVLAPKADARMDFADGSKRYVLAAQREGKASGSGPLAGATVAEWGFHDVDPASGANAHGYLVFTGVEGDLAYVRYAFRAVPVPGADGKPRFVANGHWEAVGGTGKLKDLRGAGSVQIHPAQRRWVLEGDLAPSH